MKPIEPGCLAIILYGRNPADIGKTVRVIELGYPGTSYRGCILSNDGVVGWIIEGDFLKYGWGWYEEKNLMRIDGHEETETKEHKELTV